MRIISFSKHWPKLQQSAFTTFRYPRGDKDWQVGERVQVYYRNRSPKREFLGIAVIVEKGKRELDSDFADIAPVITEKEARDDGFTSVGQMQAFMEHQYGLDYISLFNKLTLRWEAKP